MHKSFLGINVALVNNKGEVLLLHRSNTRWFSGHFGLISGFVEQDEKLVNAAVRESEEEIGIKLSANNLRLFYITHRKSDDGTQFVDFFFSCNKWVGEPIIRENKADLLQWHSLNNMPSNLTISVEKALNYIKSNTVVFEEIGFSPDRM